MPCASLISLVSLVFAGLAGACRYASS